MSRLALGVLVAALLAMISAHPIQVSDDTSKVLAKASVSEDAFPPDNDSQQHGKRGSVFSGHGLVFGPSGGGDGPASSSSITGDYGLVVSPGKVQSGGASVVSQTVDVGGVPYTVSGEILQCPGEAGPRLPGCLIRSFASLRGLFCSWSRRRQEGGRTIPRALLHTAFLRV
ncbi:hypothetical protein PG984_004271 [Apiospora sp. TS-2023a]